MRDYSRGRFGSTRPERQMELLDAKTGRNGPHPRAPQLFRDSHASFLHADAVLQVRDERTAPRGGDGIKGALAGSSGGACPASPRAAWCATPGSLEAARPWSDGSTSGLAPDRRCRNGRIAGLTGIASGRNGVRAKAAIPLRIGGVQGGTSWRWRWLMTSQSAGQAKAGRCQTWPQSSEKPRAMQ
jgi:hypothetical protein